MGTLEMIKELTENPEKKFVNILGHIVEHSKTKGIVFSRPKGLTCINLNDKWEEVVEKPVSFMEAVESGKKIQVEHDFIDDDIDYLGEKYASLDVLLWELGEKLSDDEVQDVIMNGKFYIED